VAARVAGPTAAMSTNPDHHPAFPQPANPEDTILWRYLDVDKFNWLVSERRLFMPVAEHLGDPFEGTTPQGELKWWRDEATKATSEEHRKILQQNRATLSAFARSFRSHYYVSCWHTNRHENSAMWNLYTQHSQSVAIRTTFTLLRDCLPSHVLTGMARYLDYTTERLPTMNMFEYIMHKRIQLEFEQEVRSVAFELTDNLGSSRLREHLFQKEEEPTFRIYAPPIDLNRLVQRIVFHPAATPAFVLEMTKYCADHDLPPPVPSELKQNPVF
jgi:hypothetical protein